MERKAEILTLAVMPWVLAIAAFSAAASLVMVGHDIGAQAERQAIADDCRYGGSFTLRHTGYKCRMVDSGRAPR